jgi:acetyl esterase/lipase
MLRVFAVAVFLATGLISPALALDEAAQTPASQEQVKKLVALWHQHMDGAHTLIEQRSAFEKFMDSTPQPTRVQIKRVDADGVEGDLMWPARLHHAIGTRAILYIHGGGFFSGSPRSDRALAGTLAKAASADVLLIDYRRTPEYQFPAQIDDALNAYRWLLESGYRNDNIVIVGVQVGGTIAIGTTLRQMQVNGPLPAAVIVMSPITDFAATGASLDGNADSDPLFGKSEFDALRKAYLEKHSPTDPAVSPLYADLSGFPPLLMQVGSHETLRDDTLRLASKAQKAGVDVTTEVWAGMVHQWQLFPFWLDDARRANQKVAEFAVAHFADKPQE